MDPRIPINRASRSRIGGIKWTSSDVAPLFEIMITGSPGWHKPRSPCTASAGCGYAAGVPRALQRRHDFASHVPRFTHSGDYNFPGMIQNHVDRGQEAVLKPFSGRDDSSRFGLHRLLRRKEPLGSFLHGFILAQVGVALTAD